MLKEHIRWLDLQDVKDDRGRLTAVEASHHIPFAIERIFYVHQVTPGIDRGGHAHRDTDQVAVAVHGSLRMDLSDGIDVLPVELNDPARGLYIPRMTWTRLYDFSPGAVCLVLASTHYDRAKSLRTWKDYLAARSLSGRGGAAGRPTPPGDDASC